jgi:hypothetical protein
VLAFWAEEGPPFPFAQVFHFDEGDMIARAFGFGVCQPVFSQLECLFPLILYL